MNKLDRQSLCDFVNVEIVRFHDARLASLERLKLKDVLRKKNPYLFKAKNVLTAAELITAIMDAFLSSSEEKIFGNFLEELAVFISQQTHGGRKSSAQGIDLEFDRDTTRYLISIKSGPNWGNSSQYRALRDNFQRAARVQRQSHQGLHVQPVLGICYGKTRTTDTGLYIKYTGQNFWYFLSGDSSLYLDIIEPIGHQAKQHNESFQKKKANLLNKFTAQFIHSFCNPDYSIDWPKLVAFNSGNLRKK